MKRRNRLGIVCTVALLALGLTTMAVAQEAEAEEEESVLIGQLSENSHDQYVQFVLTDPESGDEVLLRGSEEELAEYVGSSVAVTGSWAEDDEGEAYFVVSAVESADE